MILASNGIIAGKGSIPYVGLLDTYTGAAAAYSLRKLTGAYTGSAITVRRSSDNTSQNIGFDVNGDLDTTALTSFVGSANAFVSVWFDQSGNGRNAIQTTATSQLRIVNNGVIETLNGKPSLYNPTGYEVGYNGAFLRSTFGLTLSQPNTYFFVGSVDNKVTWLISNGSTNSYGIYREVNITGASFGAALTITQAASINTQRLFFALGNSTNSRIATNGAAGTTGNAGTNGVNGITISASATTTASNTSKYQEVILWNSNKTTDRIGIEANINSFYTIY